MWTSGADFTLVSCVLLILMSFRNLGIKKGPFNMLVRNVWEQSISNKFHYLL